MTLTKDPNVAELRIEIESLTGAMRVLAEGYDRMKAERDAAIAAINGAQPQRSAETAKLGDPHPHWLADAKNESYPKTVEEWDPHKDPVGQHLTLAEKRLRMSIDRDDPRAPAEMALVSRWDLMTLIHDWWHKSAVFDIWRSERAGKVTAQPVAWSTPITTGRQLTSLKDIADRWRDSGAIVEELYVACPPQLPDVPQTAPDTETIHQIIYRRVYNEVQHILGEQHLTGTVWLATQQAAEDVASALSRPKDK